MIKCSHFTKRETNKREFSFLFLSNDRITGTWYDWIVHSSKKEGEIPEKGIQISWIWKKKKKSDFVTVVWKIDVGMLSQNRINIDDTLMIE